MDWSVNQKSTDLGTFLHPPSTQELSSVLAGGALIWKEGGRGRKKKDNFHIFSCFFAFLMTPPKIPKEPAFSWIGCVGCSLHSLEEELTWREMACNFFYRNVICPNVVGSSKEETFYDSIRIVYTSKTACLLWFKFNFAIRNDNSITNYEKRWALFFKHCKHTRPFKMFCKVNSLLYWCQTANIGTCS